MQCTFLKKTKSAFWKKGNHHLPVIAASTAPDLHIPWSLFVSMVSSTAFPIVGSSITSVRKLPSVLFRNPSWNTDSHCWFQPFPMLNMSVAAISLCKLLDHFTRPNFWTPSWNDVMWRAARKRRLCEACTKVQPITHLTCWVLFPPLFSRLNVK